MRGKVVDAVLSALGFDCDDYDDDEDLGRSDRRAERNSNDGAMPSSSSTSSPSREWGQDRARLDNYQDGAREERGGAVRNPAQASSSSRREVSAAAGSGARTIPRGPSSDDDNRRGSSPRLHESSGGRPMIVAVERDDGAANFDDAPDR